jgi:hypothetical protein
MFVRQLNWIGLLGLTLVFSSCNRESEHLDDGLNQVVIAKIVVQPNKKTVFNLHKNSLEDFYDQQVSLLEGGELTKIAGSKSKENLALVAAVKLQVARIKGSSVLNLIAKSASSSSGKLYLNSLIETYIERVQGTRDDSIQGQLPDVKNQAKIEEAYQKVQLAEKNLAMFKLENESSATETEQLTSKRRLKKLETALSFYNSELEQMNKLGLENDIRRRSSSTDALPDMPEEFARLISTGLSPNEQAFLDSLSKSDERTKIVTRALAETDTKARSVSYRHQADAVQELINDIKKRSADMEIKFNESTRLEAELSKVRSHYNELKTPPSTQDPLIKENNIEGVIVSVIQEPMLVDKEK